MIVRLRHCLALLISLMGTNYSIQWDVVDGGGGVLMSSNYTLTDSVVQPSAIGESMSVGYTLQAGFMGHRMMTGMV